MPGCGRRNHPEGGRGTYSHPEIGRPHGSPGGLIWLASRRLGGFGMCVRERLGIGILRLAYWT
jgi:hypothetical protein